MKILILLLTLPLISFAAPEAKDLNEELKTLDLTEGQAPNGISQEKLYSIQDRALPLKNLIEISLYGGQNLTGNGFLNTNQAGLGVGFHFNHKWSVNVAHYAMFNKFTQAADSIYEKQGMLPDVAFAKSRNELGLDYNLYYGKFRVSQNQVYYFDHFIGAGATQTKMNTADATGYMVQTGLALWLPPYGAAKIGIKNYTQKEKMTLKENTTNSAQAYMAYSYVF